MAINAILERKGAKTALVTTEGFRDVYEIGRVNRPDSFNLAFRKHVPLIPRALRYEVTERMLYDGSVSKPLDEDDARAVAQAIKAEDVESVAVLFLHSYVNIAHEARMVELLREALPGAFITASHHVSREQREYERTSTIAANAYVGPRVSTYLERLEKQLEGDGFAGNLLIMQSSGGLCDVATAREQCIQMLESGPAAGVVASKTVSDVLGIERRDLLRHGRHDRQGLRAASRRRGALERLLHRRLQRRSRDSHSGARHQRDRHRRRQHRVGR